ncbi:MAG: DUF935 family protein [Gammaproteobacteria bacterium]|nr:DUF935 family protein [Gammaproteobacteria bacterium]
MADMIDRVLAGHDSDPMVWSSIFSVLPNPDTVLRRLGRQQEAYDLLTYDAHVLGELRSVRAGLLALQARLEPGDESRRARRAHELCAAVLDRDAAPNLSWADTRWSMARAVFLGYAVHEVVWRRDGAFVVPELYDRPNRRFRFDLDRNLRLLTRTKPVVGEPVEDRKFLLSRHMASDDNPYGVAVFSACFWPHAFKRIGWRAFTGFAKKFGLPWPVGKYAGAGATGRAEEMVRQMLDMLDSGVIALPDDETVEFLTAGATVGRSLPQERLMAAANREISKALTSQTLATEIDGQGSRAASETHHLRESEVQRSDRTIPLASINELLRWTTEINFGEEVAPPRWEYVEAPPAEREWAETIDVARRYVQVPAAFAHERLGIPMPQAGEDVLGSDAMADDDPLRMSRCPGCGAARRFAAGQAEDDAFERGLQALEGAAEAAGLASIGRDLAGPVVEAARADPGMLLGRLAELHPRMDAEALQERLARLIFTAETWARLSVDGDG